MWQAERVPDLMSDGGARIDRAAERALRGGDRAGERIRHPHLACCAVSAPPSVAITGPEARCLPHDRAVRTAGQTARPPEGERGLDELLNSRIGWALLWCRPRAVRSGRGRA